MGRIVVHAPRVWGERCDGRVEFHGITFQNAGLRAANDGQSELLGAYASGALIIDETQCNSQSTAQYPDSCKYEAHPRSCIQVVLNDCQFINNRGGLPRQSGQAADGRAAAISFRGNSGHSVDGVQSSRLTLNRVLVQGNGVSRSSSAQYNNPWGGALSFQGGLLRMENCTVTQNFINTAGAMSMGEPAAGGGLMVRPAVQTSTINMAPVGETLMDYRSAVQLINNTFNDNRAHSGGSDVHIHSPHPTSVFENNRFNNMQTGGSWGGTAVYVAQYSSFDGESGLSVVFNIVPLSSVALTQGGIESAVRWKCALGQYMSATTSIARTDFTGCVFDCPSGTYGASPYLTSPSDCSACTPGNYCGVRTATPAPCPNGTHLLPGAVGTSVSSCLPCTPGAYNDVPGRSNESCIACPAGSFTEDLRSEVCSDCPQGGYCPSAGAATRMVWQPCAAGTYSAALGASDASTCLNCDAGTEGPQIGATSASACRQCRAGSYSPSAGRPCRVS